MAVKIRMKMMGRKHRPFFRICVMDSRTPRDGRAIEELGTYDPMVAETDARVMFRMERVVHWLSVGARPSDKVGVLLRKYGPNGSHLAQQREAQRRLAAKKDRNGRRLPPGSQSGRHPEARASVVAGQVVRVAVAVATQGDLVQTLEPTEGLTFCASESRLAEPTRERTARSASRKKPKRATTDEIATQIVEHVARLHQVNEIGTVTPIFVAGTDLLAIWQRLLPAVLSQMRTNRNLQELLVNESLPAGARHELQRDVRALLDDPSLPQFQFTQIPLPAVDQQEQAHLQANELTLDACFQLATENYSAGQDVVLRVHPWMRSYALDAERESPSSPVPPLPSFSAPLRIEVHAELGHCQPLSAFLRLPPRRGEFRDFLIPSEKREDLSVIIHCYYKNECVMTRCERFD